jgi:hypothetical protein
MFFGRNPATVSCRISTREIVYQLCGESRNNEPEADLPAVPPKPGVMSKAELEVVGAKTSSVVTSINERENATDETEAKRE